MQQCRMCLQTTALGQLQFPHGSPLTPSNSSVVYELPLVSLNTLKYQTRLPSSSVRMADHASSSVISSTSGVFLPLGLGGLYGHRLSTNGSLLSKCTTPAV